MKAKVKIGDTNQLVISKWKREPQGQKMKQVVVHTATGKKRGVMKYSSQTKHIKQ